MPDDHSRDQYLAHRRRTTNVDAQIANAAEQDNSQEVHVCDQSIGALLLGMAGLGLGDTAWWSNRWLTDWSWHRNRAAEDIAQRPVLLLLCKVQGTRERLSLKVGVQRI